MINEKQKTNLSGDIITANNSTNKIEKFIQQNSPINNNLTRNETIRDILQTDLYGNFSVVPSEIISRKKHGKISQVITMCSFSYDKDVDISIFDLKKSNKITAYDLRIYNAVCTIYLNGRRKITLNEIYSVVTGYTKSNPNQNQIRAIEGCLKKLSSINVFIDITEEINSNIIQDKQPLIEAGILKDNNDKLRKVTIEAKMLSYSLLTAESENGKTFKSIKILSEPTLLTYNLAKKTLITIPMDYIGLRNSNISDRTIAFQDYLLVRIICFKNKKMLENKILYSTLYRDSGVDVPADKSNKKRDRAVIKKMMDEWVSAGLLKSYSETKKGNAVDGIIFELANAPPKQKAG